MSRKRKMASITSAGLVFAMLLSQSAVADLGTEQVKAAEEAAKTEASAQAEAAPAQETKPEPAKAPATQNNKKQTVAKPVTNRTVRVDIEKLDALMNQVSELIIAKNSLVAIGSTESGDFQNQTYHEQI